MSEQPKKIGEVYMNFCIGQAPSALTTSRCILLTDSPVVHEGSKVMGCSIRNHNWQAKLNSLVHYDCQTYDIQQLHGCLIISYQCSSTYNDFAYRSISIVSHSSNA